MARPRAADRREVERYVRDRASFRREQLVLEDGRTLGEALEPWQAEHVFGPLDERDGSGLPRYRLAYVECPRGHGKTAMAAAEAVTELTLGGGDRRIFCFAVDEDQARLLHEAAAGFVRRNPLLARSLVVDRLHIRSPRTGSYLRVMAADAASAHGLTPDLVIFDELAQLERRDLWDAAFTAIAKKPTARMVAITTPGWRRDSVCWQVRDAARTTDGYYFWSAGGRLASWLDAAELERQRTVLPTHVFRRLHEGLWSEGEGAFITGADLARCIRPARIARQSCSEPSEHVLALDLGLTNDRTAAAVVHRTERGIALDLLRVWQGSRAAPIEITTEVEPFLRQALADFPRVRVVLDPWQARSTHERLVQWHARVEAFAFTPGRIDEMTRNLYALTQAGDLELYPDSELERELLDVQIVERSYGLRIDHRRDGHDDRVIALAMAAHTAMQRPLARGPSMGLSGVVVHGEPHRLFSPLGDLIDPNFIPPRGLDPT